MKFEYWQSTKNRNWYWHLLAGNNQVIAQGEGYVNKADCEHVINLIRNQAAGASVTHVNNPNGR